MLLSPITYRSTQEGEAEWPHSSNRNCQERPFNATTWWFAIGGGPPTGGGEPPFSQGSLRAARA
eukprot:9652127-Prorocentrum_lima.AAC.1